MSLVSVTLACGDYDRTRPLIDGRVRPEGIDLNYLPMMMPESAFRMQRSCEFEASEMSLSWYSRLVAEGAVPYRAIPVFPSRTFRHSSIYINRNSGISSPADLFGKRVGCPEYQMTAAVWVKGILAERYGVPVESVRYFTGGLEQAGRKEREMDLPPEIDIQDIGPSQTLAAMLANGDIDALYTAHQPSSFQADDTPVTRLFEDYRTEEREYFAATTIFPIMHVIVIREDVLDRSPWVARSLMKAFEQAKALAYADLRETTALAVTLPWLTCAYEESVADLGSTDYWSYGLAANRHVLDRFLDYSYTQGLTKRRLQPEELFVPSTLEISRI